MTHFKDRPPDEQIEILTNAMHTAATGRRRAEDGLRLVKERLKDIAKEQSVARSQTVSIMLRRTIEHVDEVLG